MARIRHSETTRRVAIPTRESRRPELRVQADQDTARGFQGLSQVTIQALGALNRSVQQHRAIRAAEQTDAGALQRMEQDAAGAPGASPEELADMNAPFRRGYLKADAAVRVRGLQEELLTEVAKAEPGTDIEPLLQERAQAILEAPEFQDPAVRKALMPALSKVMESTRAAWQKIELGEIFERQQESLTELAAVAIRDGSLLTEQGLSAFYENLNSEDFAYLNTDDVHPLVVRAAMRELATGAVPPERVEQFLEMKLPGTEVSLGNGEFAEDLAAAARAGQEVLAAKAAEERKVKFAQMDAQVHEMSRRGTLTYGSIDRLLREQGFSPDDPVTAEAYVSKRRYYENQMEADQRRREAEARRRREENSAREALEKYGPWELSDAQLSKLATEEWRAAGPNEKAAVVARWASVGAVVTPLKNLMDRASPESGEAWNQAAEWYKRIRTEHGPKVASMYLSEKNAGYYEQFNHDTEVLGYTPEQSVAYMNAPERIQEDATRAVASVWDEIAAEYAEDENGNPRTEKEMREAREAAIRVLTATPSVSPESAVRAGFGLNNTRYTAIKGRRTPAAGIPTGTEEATEVFLDEVTPQLVAAGVIEDGEEVTVAANPADPNQLIVVDDRGFPVTDPDTRGYIAFSHYPTYVPDPDTGEFRVVPGLASKYAEFTRTKAANDARKGQAYRQTYEVSPRTPGVFQGLGKPEGSFDELMELEEKIDDLRGQVSRLPDTSPLRKRKEAELKAMEARYGKANELRQRSGIDIELPDNFIDFLRR